MLDQAIQAAAQPPEPKEPDPRIQSEVNKNNASAEQSKATALEKTVNAGVKGAEALMMTGGVGPGGMSMQPTPPSVAPLQPPQPGQPPMQ